MRGELMLLSMKRAAKMVRNAARDPWPRQHVLDFDGVEINDETLLFRYRAKGVPYVVCMTVPSELMPRLIAMWAQDNLKNSLTAIGLAFAAPFFKLSDFAGVRINTGSLDGESRLFFEDFFVGGLGEFRFLQGLDPRRRVSVIAESAAPKHAPSPLPLRDHVLLLNGGGKDTIVAAELLRQSGQSFTWLSIAPNETRRRVILRSGNPSSIEVGFRIEGGFGGNQAYDWGHTPYASIVMAIGALMALLTQSRYVISGNELSADSENIVFRGHRVNHQYSKSSAYEIGFWKFVRRNVHPNIEVLSILRPFQDVQLAMLFSSMDQYFVDFVSCNARIISGRWCKRCPKCAFTALAIGAFTGVSGLEKIFGENVLQRVAIRRWICKLSEGAIKPWECVGSKQECVLALAMLLAKEPDLDYVEKPRRADWERITAKADVAVLREYLLDRTSDRHLIPEKLRFRLNGVLKNWKYGGELQVLRSSIRNDRV